MRILVLGLEGASPELLLGDERLSNIRHVMEWGGYGVLRGVAPPSMVPSWLCMATSQDPGSLGVYGPRDRTAFDSYDLSDMMPIVPGAQTIWDVLALQGWRCTIVGDSAVHQATATVNSYIDRTPTNPTTEHIERVLLQSMNDREICAGSEDSMSTQARTACRASFEEVRRLLGESEWQYFQFVDCGLARLRSALTASDSREESQPANHAFADRVLHQYASALDEEIGHTLEALSDDTILLIASAHGTQYADGTFAINDWLVREGLLTLREHPASQSRLDPRNVDWEQTRVWGTGGSWAKLYINLKGRESRGVVDSAHYESLIDDLKGILVTAASQAGGLDILTASPKDLYKETKGIAPDLLVHFSGASWGWSGRLGSSGDNSVSQRRGKNVDSPRGCFILATSTGALNGEVADTGLLDIAPTLLELVGLDVPATMQGRSLVDGRTHVREAPAALSMDEEEIIRQRLVGLGYIE